MYMGLSFPVKTEKDDPDSTLTPPETMKTDKLSFKLLELGTDGEGAWLWGVCDCTA